MQTKMMMMVMLQENRAQRTGAHDQKVTDRLPKSAYIQRFCSEFPDGFFFSASLVLVLFLAETWDFERTFCLEALRSIALWVQVQLSSQWLRRFANHTWQPENKDNILHDGQFTR